MPWTCVLWSKDMQCIPNKTVMWLIKHKLFIRGFVLMIFISLVLFTIQNPNSIQQDYYMILQSQKRYDRWVRSLENNCMVAKPKVFPNESPRMSSAEGLTEHATRRDASIFGDRNLSHLLDPDVIIITNWTIHRKRNISNWLQDGNESFKNCTNLSSSMRCWFDSRPEAYNKSHAVLFRGLSLFDQSRNGPPVYRPPGQKWIFYEMEPPTWLWGAENGYNGYNHPVWKQNGYNHPIWKQFNITVTYTSDSTVPLNKYRQVCEPNKEWKPSGINHAKGKDGKVAWFVSDCKTSSLREAYVAQLKQYIPVDIFGTCGNLKMCPKSEPDAKRCARKMLNRKYKFYLAFENSLCDEYYTEKLWRAVSSEVVPVVMGAFDYSHLLPPESYVDVKNFSSPEALARFLLYLDQHDTVYNRYIENKSRFECRLAMHDEGPFPCRLCRHLHEFRHRTEVAPDLRIFWGVKKRCISPQDYYTGVADGIVQN